MGIIDIRSLFPLPDNFVKGKTVPREQWRQGINVMNALAGVDPQLRPRDRELLLRAIDDAFHGDVFGDEFTRFNMPTGLDRPAELDREAALKYWLYGHEVCNSLSTNNILFSPAHYIKNGFITAEDIDKLKAGAKLLSVGSGPAFLERFMLEEEVPAKNIVLSDLKLDYLPKDIGCATRQFDMWGQWYSFNQKFDYIIFPESIFPKLDDDAIIADYLRTQGDPDRLLDPSGEARIINDYYYSQLLRQALTCLKKDGVLRARHFNPGLEPKVLEELALQDGYKISVTLYDNGSELRIKKIN